MLPPPAATKPKTPIAFARSAGSVKSVITSPNETAETIAGLGHAHAAAGRNHEAIFVLAELSEMASRTYVSPFEVATVHAARADADLMFDWLERAFQERSCMMAVWLRVDPRFDRFRDDGRFSHLLQRIGVSA